MCSNGVVQSLLLLLAAFMAVGQDVDVQIGLEHACAVGRVLKCWGSGEYGQLGLENNRKFGTSVIQMGENLPPVDLGSGKHATQVALGVSHTCALLDDSSVKCWGKSAFLGWIERSWGSDGTQAGYGDDVQEMGDNLPALDLGTGSFALQITASKYHSCALLNDRSIKCWGTCKQGACGLGHEDRIQYKDQMGDALPSVDLGSGSMVMQVQASFTNTCALLDDGSVKCWGAGDTGINGQESSNDIGSVANQMGENLPAINLGRRKGLFGKESYAASIAVGTWHACALLQGGSVKCWGKGDFGCLGRGDTMTIGNLPGQMGSNLRVVDLGIGRIATQISLGTHLSCAILDDDSAKCWGRNRHGQLGQGHSRDDVGSGQNEMGDNLLGINLGSMKTARLVSAGAKNTCVVTNENEVKCMGKGTQGVNGLSKKNIGKRTNHMGDSLIAIPLNLWGEPSVPSQVSLLGSLIFKMFNATRFIEERGAIFGMRTVIKRLLKVPSSWVQNVSLNVLVEIDSPNSRKLLADNLEIELENDVRIQFQIVTPLDQPAYVTATVLAETFDRASSEEATEVINSVMASNIFEEDYQAVVVFKSAQIDESVSIPPSSNKDSTETMFYLVALLVLAVVSCCTTLAICFALRRRGQLQFQKLSMARSEVACSLLELLSPPDGVSAKQMCRVQNFASTLLSDIGERDVFICYALNQRATDAEDTGPGMYYAVAVLKALSDQGLKCALAMPGASGNSIFLKSLNDPMACEKVLLVVETCAVFQSRDCLESIYAALENSMEIKRLRFDADMPEIDSLWPQINSADEEGVCYFKAAETGYLTLPTYPPESAGLLIDALSLQALAIDLKKNISVSQESVERVRSSQSKGSLISLKTTGFRTSLSLKTPGFKIEGGAIQRQESIETSESLLREKPVSHSTSGSDSSMLGKDTVSLDAYSSVPLQKLSSGKEKVSFGDCFSSSVPVQKLSSKKSTTHNSSSWRMSRKIEKRCTKAPPPTCPPSRKTRTTIHRHAILSDSDSRTPDKTSKETCTIASTIKREESFSAPHSATGKYSSAAEARKSESPCITQRSTDTTARRPKSLKPTKARESKGRRL